MNNWIEYWSHETQFACNLHKRISYDAIFEGLKPFVLKHYRVLDFGCGEALFAKRLSYICKDLYLYDAAETLMDNLKSKIQETNIHIHRDYVDLEEIDLILISSVSQYISKESFTELLKSLKPCLSKNGKIIISDVVPIKNSLVIEIYDLLRISSKNGFFFNALLKLASSFFGKYSKIRSSFPLTKYNPQSLEKIAGSLKYSFELQKTNLGLNSNRYTVILKN